MSDYSDWFMPPRPMLAEGARIGLFTCVRCGAAVMTDPSDEFDPLNRHVDWHRATDTDTEPT